MSAQHGVSKIEGDLYIDWSIPSEALITTSLMEVGIKGLMFDQAVGEIEPNVLPPAMPTHDSSLPAQLQV